MRAHVKRIALGIIVFSFLFSACHAPAPKVAENSTPPIFLWKILAKDNDAIQGWILGSIHIGDSRQERQFDGAILDAYAQSDALAVEIDAGSPKAQAETAKLMVSQAFYKKGTSLSQKLTEEDYQLYLKMIPKEVQVIADRLQPWFAGLMVALGDLDDFKQASKPGLDSHPPANSRGDTPSLSTESGVDKLFLAKSRDIIPIHSLETVAQQFDAIRAGTEEFHLANLRETLQLKKSNPNMTLELLDAYEAGSDEDLLSSLDSSMAQTDEAQEYMAGLLTKRNKVMSDSLSKLLKAKGKVFAIVGALHVVGEHTVQDFLESEGYRFERVAPKGEKRVLPVTQKAASLQASSTVNHVPMRVQVQWPGEPSEYKALGVPQSYKSPDNVSYIVSDVPAPSDNTKSSVQMVCEMTVMMIQQSKGGSLVEKKYDPKSGKCSFGVKGKVAVVGRVLGKGKQVFILTVAIPMTADAQAHQDSIKAFFDSYRLVPANTP